LNSTIQALASSELTEDEFPFVKPPPPDATGNVPVAAGGADRALSVRTHFATPPVVSGLAALAAATEKKKGGLEVGVYFKQVFWGNFFLEHALLPATTLGFALFVTVFFFHDPFLIFITN
jgi:hypothetical protein